MEGYFFTCACPKNQKVKFALNLIHLGAKDWREFVTHAFSSVERAAVSWENFLEMFRAEYVPLVERERVGSTRVLIAQEDDKVSDQDH